MKRLDDIRAALEQELEAVVEGLRILAGIARPGEVAVAATTVKLRHQMVMPTATRCGFCWRRVAPAAAG